MLPTDDWPMPQNCSTDSDSVGAVLGIVGKDSRHSIGWEPHNKQLGSIGQDLSVK